MEGTQATGTHLSMEMSAACAEQLELGLPPPRPPPPRVKDDRTLPQDCWASSLSSGVEELRLEDESFDARSRSSPLRFRSSAAAKRRSRSGRPEGEGPAEGEALEAVGEADARPAARAPMPPGHGGLSTAAAAVLTV